VTTPLAVERLALYACGVAAEQDGVYVEVDVESEDGRDGLVDLLYRRALLRTPTDAELEHMRGLYADVVGAGGDGKAWVKLTCFAILTSMEAVFY
jgi:hypothetical protein